MKTSKAEQVVYYREMLSLSQNNFLKAKNPRDKDIIRKQVETFRRLHKRYSTLAGMVVSNGQLALFKSQIDMENNTETNELRSVYEMLDTQTVKQRKELVKGLLQNKVSHQQYAQWFSLRANIPEKYHQLICELVGEQLNFPKVKLVPVIQNQDETV